MRNLKKEFEILYQRYYKDVYYFVRSMTEGNLDVAEEITQNTFYKAIKAADRFRGDCDIRVWLCQIAKNDYRNYLRKQKRMADGKAVEEVLEQLPSDEEPVLQKMMDTEAAGEINRILDQMEEPYRNVFTLRVLHDVSYKKIAATYGKSVSWARVTYYRAKSRILDSMKEA